MQRAAHAYLQTQVTTTSQGDVVILLYDGVLNFLNQAKERLAVNDMAGKGIAITKALDVIAELDGSLNIEKGGDLARNLHGLYTFCQNHLVGANIKKSSAMIDDVIRVLSGLRGAYAEILAMPEAQAAAQEAAANLGTKAMSVTRASSGTAGPPAASPQPGAGARMRASYARAAEDGNAGQRQAHDQARDQTVPQSSPLSSSVSPDQAQAGERAPDETPVPRDLPPPLQGGFAKKFGGSGMFQRYAAAAQK